MRMRHDEIGLRLGVGSASFTRMKRIALDRKDARIKRFVRYLAAEPDGAVVELHGEPLVRILPLAEPRVDRAQLKAAILRRRDASRRLGTEWESVDNEMWARIPPSTK